MNRTAEPRTARARTGAEGAFVCIEGVDGCGKTTLARAVVEALGKRGTPALLLDKNPSWPIDPIVRSHLDRIGDALWRYPKTADVNGLSDRHWLSLLALWFAFMDETIVSPAVHQGYVVIADGWCGKFIARFSLKPGRSLADVVGLFAQVRKPDLSILLDVAPDSAFARRANFSQTERGGADGLVGDPRDTFVTYQSRVREVFCRLAQLQSWRRVDGEQSVDQVERDVLALLPLQGSLLSSEGCQGSTTRSGHSFSHLADFSE